jgi:hypothetical protein
MLAVNAILLRLALASPTVLATRMRQVDLLDQRPPLCVIGYGEIAALVAAFDATDGLATLAAGKAKGKVVVNLDVCAGTPPSRALCAARR